MTITGRAAWVYPDHFDVDFIIGAANIGLQEPEEIARCLMKEYEPDFLEKAAPGDLLVAGKNFGYGHGHPQPMMGLRHIGITCVVAESFAFPFYRSELASGMKLFVCPGVAWLAERGDYLTIDVQRGTVSIPGKGSLPLAPLGRYPLEVMKAGGVIPHLKNTLG